MAICTISEVEDVLSQHGVRLSTNDDGGDAISDSDRVNNAIERATQKLYQYVSLRYTISALENNSWAKWACAVFAAVQLMRRRGGAVPPGLMDEYNEYLEYLKEVKTGTSEIPGLTQSNEPGLTMSNVTVDQRYRSAKIRTVNPISAGDATSKKPRRIDQNGGWEWI